MCMRLATTPCFILFISVFHFSYDREEVFSAINLAVKANDLYEALNQFVRGEVLEGDNAYYCERCCVKRRAVKRLSIHTLPPVLCLHLKRFDFDWDRQIPVKFSHYFKFPRQLDMSPYLTGSVQVTRIDRFVFIECMSETNLTPTKHNYMLFNNVCGKFLLGNTENQNK
ncbi:unnamed protein product [Trichobilharzia regenti]|nr:unnamed protein product [Trichobilharzia regenti]